MSDIYLSLAETPAVVTLSQPVAATQVAATVTVGNTVTVALDANSLSALENVTVTVGAAVSVSNFPATQVVSVSNLPASQVVTGTVALDSASLMALENITVTVGSTVALAAGSAQVGSVTISNFPSTQTISGTVTANGGDFVFSESQDTSSAKGVLIGFEDDASTEYRKVTDAQPLPISISAINNTGGFSGSLPVSGTVTVGGLPSGALTTRFGSVATANLAFITSAVTNTSRKYLLAQNISAGTVTIGIGFSPTTTQGIQLTAGAGLTFDSFCPTGAVYWLGAVTGAAFTILEG